jgi:hypothetical protein
LQLSSYKKAQIWWSKHVEQIVPSAENLFDFDRKWILKKNDFESRIVVDRQKATKKRERERERKRLIGTRGKSDCGEQKFEWSKEIEREKRKKYQEIELIKSVFVCVCRSRLATMKSGYGSRIGREWFTIERPWSDSVWFWTNISQTINGLAAVDWTAILLDVYLRVDRSPQPIVKSTLASKGATKCCSSDSHRLLHVKQRFDTMKVANDGRDGKSIILNNFDRIALIIGSRRTITDRLTLIK